MAMYKQTYYGDESVVGFVIGVNGENLNELKNSVIAQDCLQWIHWDNLNKSWEVKGTTLAIVQYAINWIHYQEMKFHIEAYQKTQAQSLSRVIVVDQSVSNHSRSDSTNWRIKEPVSLSTYPF